MAKGTVILTILEHISETGCRTLDLMGVFLSMPYGASRGRIIGAADRQHQSHDLLTRKRASFSSYICLLKKDGLIAENYGDRTLALTERGKNKLDELKRAARIYMPRPSYGFRKGTNLILITFDVPEKERRKRDWLRIALKSMRMTMLQRSVWIGRNLIPEKFVQDLRKTELSENVHILQIAASGTVSRVYH